MQTDLIKQQDTVTEEISIESEQQSSLSHDFAFYFIETVSLKQTFHIYKFSAADGLE